MGRSIGQLGVGAALAAMLAAPGCIVIPKPKPFAVGVVARQLDPVSAQTAEPLVAAVAMQTPAPVLAAAQPVDVQPAMAATPPPPPPRTGIKGAGDGSMKLERVVITGSSKDIPHRAPNFSAEQAAAMLCGSQKMGFGRENARRMHEATLKARQAREDFDNGKITLKQMDQIELKRQDAVIGYLMPVPILNLLVTPAEKKQDMPEPVYGPVVLEHTDLFSFMENGKEVVAVTGTARNTGASRVELPPLTLRALDEWDFSIAGQSSLLPFETLEPGEAREFEIRFFNPPEYTTEVYVHFAPPFMYRAPRDCEFFDPAIFDQHGELKDAVDAGAAPPAKDASYTASELNLLTLFYRRESEAAWRCQTYGATCPAKQRLRWQDMFAMSEAVDEAWIKVRAAEEARIAARADEAEAAQARDKAIARFQDLGAKALARAGDSTPDIAVDVASSTFGRDEDGLFVEVVGKVRNTGSLERKVDALMMAFVDRKELPLSSVAVDLELILAPNSEQDFSQRLQAGVSRGPGRAAPVTFAERRRDTSSARIPPRTIPWEMRVGAMTRAVGMTSTVMQRMLRGLLAAKYQTVRFPAAARGWLCGTKKDGDLPMKPTGKRTLVLAGAILALAAPAFAQDATTLQHVTTKGTVIKADMQGQALELPMTYKADGSYTTNAMGQAIAGKWRIDGEKLCTVSDMNPAETCVAYPAGKKPGDEFKVTNPMLGEVSVTINK